MTSITPTQDQLTTVGSIIGDSRAVHGMTIVRFEARMIDSTSDIYQPHTFALDIFGMYGDDTVMSGQRVLIGADGEPYDTLNLQVR